MKQRFENSVLVANWYEVKNLLPDLYIVDEQDHVAFFIIKDRDKGLFVDSGLGLIKAHAVQLLEHLKITRFDVLATHAHCEHSGLNYLAEKIYIFEEEWIKFKELNEKDQLPAYYEMLKTELPWPADLEGSPSGKSWNPTDFISEGEVLKFGSWNLESLFLPGHTRGHLVFFDRNKEALFLGDFIVSGTNFIHLKDSSVASYYSSLKKLAALISSLKSPLLLPCHDQIPLDPNYVQETLKTLEWIKDGKINPLEEIVEGNEYFSPAWVYDTGTVRFTIRTDQLDQFRSVK